MDFEEGRSKRLKQEEVTLSMSDTMSGCLSLLPFLFFLFFLLFVGYCGHQVYRYIWIWVFA